MRNRLLLILMLLMTVAISVSGCAATYQPTAISEVDFPIIKLSNGQALSASAEFYYLKKLDNLEGATKSSFSSDQKFIEKKVKNLLTMVQGADIVVVAPGESTAGRFHCDIKEYFYVSWMEVLSVFLPAPYSSNESICVVVTLTDRINNRVVSRHEEWGYNYSERFFAFYESPREPPTHHLRNYMLKKAIKLVLDDLKKEVDCAEPSKSSLYCPAPSEVGPS